MTVQLEVCVSDLAGINAAVTGGADRLELCTALEIGGLTPTRGLVKEALREDLPVNVLVRTRGGNFVYSNSEIEIMRQDIIDFRELGAIGFVIGALTVDGALDLPNLGLLLDACGDCEVTLHRAFDYTANQELALKQAKEMGFHRVLTSGGAANVIGGLEMLQRLNLDAGLDIQVVPGGGIRPDNLAIILEALLPKVIHASCKSRAASISNDLALGAMGNGGEARTDPNIVRALAEIIGKHS